jgi:hypothetical protein
MAKGARNQKIDINSYLEVDANDAIAKANEHFNNNDLLLLYATIFKYMQPTQETFNKLIHDDLLKRIRHSYLHMSSKDEFGLNPRFNEDGKRWRQPYDG